MTKKEPSRQTLFLRHIQGHQIICGGKVNMPGEKGGFVPQNYHYYADFYGPYYNRIKRSDDELKEEISNALGFDSWVNVGQIDIDVRNSVVTLSGTVDTLMEKRAAGDDAWDVPGVLDVINNLKIRS